MCWHALEKALISVYEEASRSLPSITQLLDIRGDAADLLVLSKEEAIHYNSMMKTWASIYCCVDQKIGHIWCARGRNFRVR